MRVNLRHTLMPGPIGPLPRRLRVLLAAAVAVLASGTASAQKLSLEELVSSVVRIKTFITPDGRTVRKSRPRARRLRHRHRRQRPHPHHRLHHGRGARRRGDRPTTAAPCRPTWSATITRPASGCCRRSRRSRSGRSRSASRPTIKERDPVVIASFGGLDMAAPAHVVAKREFAGSWEYLLDEAIFTSPPHPVWSGAALISRDGKLVGVGSLIVGDATGKSDGVPGNMFVPIDLLPPILADLIAAGRAARARGKPWLGVSTEDVARPAVGEPRDARAARPKRRGCAAATSSSASTARRRPALPISIARSGRSAPPAPPSRSTCCKAATRCAST